MTTTPNNSSDDDVPDIEEPEVDEDADARELREQNKVLRETIFQLKMELDRFKSPALMVADVLDVQSEEKAVIKVPNGNKFLVNLSDDVADVTVNDTVVVEQKNLTVVDNLDYKSDADVDQFVIVEKPTITWDQIGGLDKQKNELQEVIEMPLQKPELFRDVGIQPPKGRRNRRDRLYTC